MSSTSKNTLSREYVLAEPKAYRTARVAAPGATAEASPQEARPAAQLVGFAKVETKPEIAKRAVWVVHGMGQQIPFETLDSLTTGILSVARPSEGVIPRVRTAKIGQQVFERVELDVLADDGTPFELHLYEAYWAPKTEGVAKLTDVIGFLTNGGLRGVLNSIKQFRRAMFGGIEGFRVPARTPFEIILTLGVLLALLAINAVVVAAAAARANLPVFGGLLMGEHWEELTALASCMSAVALTFGAVLFLAELSKPGVAPPWKKHLLRLACWTGLAITLFTVLASAVLMTGITRIAWMGSVLADMHVRRLQACATLVILCCGAVIGLAMVMRGFLRSAGIATHESDVLGFLFGLAFLLHVGAIGGPVAISVFGLQAPERFLAMLNWLGNPLWVWPFLIALSAQVRTLMLQYVGDVAIYITPNKLDRFDQIRTAIKELARASACALYQARNEDDTDFEYEKIAIVGHSLGSVIAYDTLNKLLTDDALQANQLRVAERTCVFETFGSPLDKIAFFFTIEGKDTLRVREQLASVVQPLIQSYPDFRKFPWINVYSRSDIISGDLKFYDLPGCTVPPGVENIKDLNAVVPLVAHVDYWKNRIVWQRLYDEVTR